MAKSNPKSTDKKLAALQRDNERLKTENSKLKSELEEHHGVFSRSWRGLVITLCVLLATIILMAGNILFWAGDTLVNNDRYVRTVTPVLQDEAVQKAVADYATVQIFKTVDVNQVIQDALPPRADFLAGTLTTQLRNGTEKTLQKVVASDKFQTIWEQTNDKAHQQLISSLKKSNGDGVINLQEVYGRLSDSLSSTKLSFLANKTLPANVGSIEVVHAEWVPKARTIVNNIGWIKPVSLLLLALFSAAAIWLSRNRRKLVIMLGSFFAGGMVVSLIAFRVIRGVIVDHFAPIYQTAADHASHIIMGSLITQTATILLLSFVIVIVAWLTGPYRSATIARNRVDLLLSGKLHETIFGSHEPAFARWLGTHKRILQWLTVGAVGTLMLLVRLTPKLVLVYSLLVLLIILVIETLASPATRKKS